MMSMFTGDEIRQLRLALGKTMKEFGALFDVTESTVSVWESGRCHPRFDTLVELNEMATKVAKQRAKATA